MKDVKGKRTQPKAIRRRTLQQINYTEELVIPTLPEMGLSTECRSKSKSVSRKGRSISVRQQTLNSNPFNIKKLLKEFEEIKCMNQIQDGRNSGEVKSNKFSIGVKSVKNLKNKNKLLFCNTCTTNSPKSAKERGNKKSKKLIQTVREYNEIDLEQKITNTLRKLKKKTFFADDDEEILPSRSTSEAYHEEEKRKKSFKVQEYLDDEINIEEMKKFYKIEQSNFRLSIDFFKSDIFETMAKKIQRAWRCYQTEKLVKRYTNMFHSIKSSQRIGKSYLKNSECRIELDEDNTSSENNVNINLPLSFEENELYPSSNILQKEKIFEQLENESPEGKKPIIGRETWNQKYNRFHEIEQEDRENSDTNFSPENNEHQKASNEILREMQKEQLERWSEIVALMSRKDFRSQEEMEELYEEIISKSKLYKTKLEKIAQIKNEDQKEETNQHSENNYTSSHPDNIKNIVLNDDSKILLNEKKKKMSIEEFKENELKKRFLKNLENNVEIKSNEVEVEKLNSNFHIQNDFEECENYQSEKSSIKYTSEEFNANKYVEYLDGDVYPLEQKNNKNINKEKQEVLMQKLREEKSYSKLIKKQRIGSFYDGIKSYDENKDWKERLSLRSHSEQSEKSNIFSEELNPLIFELKKESGKIRSLKKSASDIVHHFQKANSLLFSKNYNDDEEDNSLENQKFTEIFEKIDAKEKEKNACDFNSSLEEIANNHEMNVGDIPNAKKRIQDFLAHDLGRNIEETMQNFMNKELYSFNDELPSPPKSDNEIDAYQVYLEDEISNEIHEYEKEFLYEFPTIEHLKSSNLTNSALPNTFIEPEKKEEIINLLETTLVLEFLVDLAKCPQLLTKVKQIENKKNKNISSQKYNRYGFLTDISTIKEFVEDLCSHTLWNNSSIFHNLNIPTGPSALEMLRYMHQNPCDENLSDNEEDDDDASIMVLPNFVFEKFWVSKVSILNDQGESERERMRIEYLKGLNKVFLRACFDCLNECFDYERNYGPYGKPFPWKKTHLFEHYKSKEEIEKCIVKAQKKIIEICSSHCGIIIDENEIIELCGSEENLAQIQEDHLSRMLAKDLIEAEERWLFYDDEETEILVETSNYILYELVSEMSNLLV